MNYTSHYSVLKNECLNYLKEVASESGNFFFSDCTFGGGGHTLAMALEIPNCEVVSFDQDPDAFANGQALIKEQNVEDKVRLYKSNFVSFDKVIEANEQKILDAGGFHGVMMDLGVSSHHFDKGERGFSFNKEAPLDMRMDYQNNDIPTARDIINGYTEDELAEIITNYGEDRFAKQIARNIVVERSKNSIETTKDLENVIFHSYPKKMRHSKAHPATKTFQALRIEVNQELRVLEDVIPLILEKLNTGGRLLVISFHSLEDRIVKLAFKKIARENDSFKILTKKPIIPSDQEILENSRSRSAKLRVIEKVK